MTPAAPTAEQIHTLIETRRHSEALLMGRALLMTSPEDAKAHMLTGIAALMANQIDEGLGYLEKASRLDPTDAEVRTNLCTAYRRLSRFGEALPHLRALAEAEPNSPRILTDLADALHAAGHLEEAELRCREALAIAETPEGLQALARILTARNSGDEAVAALTRATALAPEHVGVLNDLGTVLGRFGKDREAVEVLANAVGRSDAPALWYNYADALARLHRFDDALEAVGRALSPQPNLHDARYLRGLLKLRRGLWREGLADYEVRFRTSGFPYSRLPGPQWNRQSLEGKTVAVLAEQGVGDRIQFVRYARDLKAMGARVEIADAGALADLLSSAVGVDAVHAGHPPRNAYDYQVPMMSLPGLFGHTPQSVPHAVPYLSADRTRYADACARVESRPGLKVGLAWRGSMLNRNDVRRSMSLEQFAPLFAIPGVSWVSLQKDPPAADLPLPQGMVELPGDSMAEAAAVISGLDLVIAIDSAVAHLAGALAIPVWIALCYASDWRWLLDRDDTPWYPTARLFRQTEPNQWEPVVARMAEALRQTAQAG